jgi:PIN domain nuclease of toxin-antitoxin system
VILLDTCVLIFDALTPERLSPAVLTALEQGEGANALVCADISLWEIAMLIAKGRLAPGTATREFCRLVPATRGIRVLPITPDIASRSAALDLSQGDPTDRLIAATCISHDAALVTADRKLRGCEGLRTVW